MTQQIVIAGSGFAGLWAALSAARAVALAGRDGDVAITVVSPAPSSTSAPASTKRCWKAWRRTSRRCSRRWASATSPAS
ncbi:hypothetical protein [Azospirillum argentinense]